MVVSSGQRSGKELIYVSKLLMECFACLIVLFAGKIVVWGQVFMKKCSPVLHTHGASSPSVVRLTISPECEACKNPRQRSSQANVYGSHAFLSDWTQAAPSGQRSIIFLKHTHLEDPGEREEVVKTEAPEGVGSFKFGQLASTGIGIQTQILSSLVLGSLQCSLIPLFLLIFLFLLLLGKGI